MSDLSLLMDMGFSEANAKRALEVTSHKGVEPAMEWLLAHGNSLESVPDEQIESGGSANKPPEEEESEVPKMEESSKEDEVEAKSIQCDECKRKFRTAEEVEFHAVNSGHQSFSQSSEEIKPLTEEEKQEQIKKIENIIKQRRAEKAEQDKRDALEKEKNRRKTGQELTHVRQKMQEQEMKQLAEMKRREKLEAKIAKQKVLEDIERDKAARRVKFGMATPSTATEQPAQTVMATIMPAQTYDECRIQVRLTNGQCLTQTFSPNEQLAAVRLFVEINRTDGTGAFSLMTNFPKKVFSDEDMNTPLSSLGLVPAAVLIVSKIQ